jgi:cysteine rich repeat protein
MPKDEFVTRLEMPIRQLIVASFFSLAVISTGPTQAAKAPLALCNADAERICHGVHPGGGKIIACLKQHKDEVSVGCAKALKALKAKRRA